MIRYRSLQKWKYQLAEGYIVQTPIMGMDVKCGFYELDVDGVLLVRKGYCWDGPSGPTWDTNTAMRASLVHDVFYQMMREGQVPRDWRYRADDLFRIHLLEDGMGRFRAWYFYRALRMFGGRAVRARKPVPSVIEAP